jgi:alanine racemase
VTNWVEISKERLEANYRTLSEAAGDEVSVLAVIKADAYGHGAGLCAPILAQAGAEWLGVTDADEGIEVRSALTKAGVIPEKQPRILVMSEGLPEDAEAIIRHSLTPIVSTIEQMQALARYSPSSLGVHLEVDTGMSRQGVGRGAPLTAVLEWLAEQQAQCGIRLEGVMTHFASAEVAWSHQTADQRHRFHEALLQVVAAGLRPQWIHAGNSSTIDNQDDSIPSLLWIAKLARTYEARAMVRSGLGLYGYCLPIEREQDYSGSIHPRVGSRLTPVMTWKTRITGLREIAEGTRVGYNGIFTAERPMRLALLPVGYADGLRRELSSATARTGGWAIIAGNRAPIIGRVSMNLTVVDVSSIPGVSVGDEAVVLGEGATAEDHAKLAETISYEILCGIKAARRLV